MGLRDWLSKTFGGRKSSQELVQSQTVRTTVQLPLEVLKLEPMASGHQSIRVTRSITWERFGPFAEALVRALGGRVLHRADSVVERVWTASIDGQQFWVALDDWDLGVSLDPCDAGAAARVPAVYARLLELRASQGAG